MLHSGTEQNRPLLSRFTNDLGPAFALQVSYPSFVALSYSRSIQPRSPFAGPVPHRYLDVYRKPELLHPNPGLSGEKHDEFMVPSETVL